MQITFLGATRTVTGSKYLLSFKEKNILIDCGLFQGPSELCEKNWQPLPFKPSTLDAVILTHAHIDHRGYLPLLVKNGFSNPIFCTYGTKDLCSLLLPDSAHLQEEDAKHANEHRHSYPSFSPLYHVSDAENALKLMQPQPYSKIINLGTKLRAQLIPAGHIIGSSLIKLQYHNQSILFTGDLGRLNDPVMKKPNKINQIDYLVIESTYGDRLHEQEPSKLTLKNIINKTIQRGGSVIIPAFAVGRSQTLLHCLSELKKEKSIPDIPIYLDSPMAINATHILFQHMDELRLSKDLCRELFDVAIYVRDVKESIQLDRNKEPKIILSASGMVSGGRILFHVKEYAPDPCNTILFTGFQSAETLGAEILSGKKFVEIHGSLVPINAHVESIGSISAHADYSEILTWLNEFQEPPRKTFITHGELNASFSLKNKIETQLGWQCFVPEYEQKESL